MPTPSTPPRVFIACAPQDHKYAELVTTRARSERLPVEFVGMDEGRTDEVGWQLECRRRVRSSRVLIVLISPLTGESTRVKWQVQCARELGVPIMGITLAFGEKADARSSDDAIQPEATIIGWRWKVIAATLMRFATTPPARRREPGGTRSITSLRGLSDKGSAA